MARMVSTTESARIIVVIEYPDSIGHHLRMYTLQELEYVVHF